MTAEPGQGADDLLRNAADYARTFEAGGTPAAPARRVAVITCMDSRIDPAALFDLKLGDAHVIRNAGGLVTDDVLRSLTLSQALLGTREVFVVQHTNCGVNASEEELRAQVAEAIGEEPGLELGGFERLEESVRRGLERLRAAPELPAGDGARGFVYDVETGRLHEVDAA